MRVSDDIKLTEGFFAGDIPNGYKIECGKCKYIFNSTEKIGEPCCCPNCKTELFYRSHWEW